MGDEEKQSLLNKNKVFGRSISHAADELHNFRSCLRWMCVDQSNPCRACLSWFLFFFLAIVVPCLSHFILACADCDGKLHRPYDGVVQLSLSSVSTVSFLCLSRFFRQYGLRRFLYLDKLCGESENVRQGYMAQLHLCSMTLMAGLFILLRSATKITHKAQSVTCLAAKWHICATLDSFDATDGETTQITSNRHVYPNEESEEDDAGDEDDDIDTTKIIMPAYAHTICFQKRQALVTYFENNKAGITVFGFMLDRTCLHTIFGIEMSLVLWLLGKTVGIS